MQRPKQTIQEFAASQACSDLNTTAMAAVANPNMSPVSRRLFGLVHEHIQDAIARLSQYEANRDDSSTTYPVVAVVRMTASWTIVSGYAEAAGEHIPPSIESLYLTMLNYHEYFQFHDDV